MSETLQTRDGRSVLRMQRWLPHPPEKVWRAVTEPERLAEWFPAKITPELRTGGGVAFEFGGNGTVTDLDPPRLIAYTWGDDHLRWELHAEGAGTRLVLTHTFDDRGGAASFGAGWHTCILALGLALDGRAGADPGVDAVALHERLIAQFGLDAGSLEDTDQGWRVRYERQLTRPAEVVWAVLTGNAPAGAAAGDHVLEHDCDGGGRLRWELTEGTGHGARLLLTHSGSGGDPEAALADGRARIGDLLTRLEQVPTTS